MRQPIKVVPDATLYPQVADGFDRLLRQTLEVLELEMKTLNVFGPLL